MATQRELDTGAKLTEEMIAAARRRIGIEGTHQTPWIEVASDDSIRHFAEGIGDDNPLWCSPAYAAKTRWKSVIATPTFICNMGVSVKKELTPEERERGRGGAMTGIHAFYSGDEWEWFRPVYPGDRLTVRGCGVNLTVKKSQFANQSVRTDSARIYWNQHGEVVAIWKNYSFHTERDTAAGKGKYSSLERPKYTPEMLERISADMDAEERRGAKPRYWEDVKEGQQFQPLCLGPLLVTDIIAFCSGWASPFINAHELRYKYMKRHPRALTLNEFGVPDVVERVHWDDDFARKIGNPYAYDYGWQRNAWLCRAVTEWMGDDAWMEREDDQFRGFCYVGDATWVKGKVTRKYVEGKDHKVEVETYCEDQRGRTHAMGHAVVRLPSKVHGAVMLPQPPRELVALPDDKPLPIEVLQLKMFA